MALKQRDEGKKYLRIKDGKIYLGKDLETPFDEIEGKITKLYFKDEEYEGSPQRKLIVVLDDEDGSYQLGVNVESSSYTSLVGFLANVDLNKPLTLHPRIENSNKDGKDITKRSILVSQDGKFAKSYFTKDDSHGLPRWEVVTVGRKKVVDKAAYLDFLEEFVIDTLVAKLDGESVVTNKPSLIKKVAVNEEDGKDEEEVAVNDFKAPWD